MPLADWYGPGHEKADVHLCETLLRQSGFSVTRGYTASSNLKFSLLAKKQQQEMAFRLLTPDGLSEDEFWKKLKGTGPVPGLAFNSRLSNLIVPALVKKCQSNKVLICSISDSKIVMIDPTLSLDQIQTKVREAESEKLTALLGGCASGKKGWRLYEDICQELFNVAFVPPLEYPRVQADTILYIRRRDLIYPNRAASGFWNREVRQRYKGEYVVLECKNYRKPISKDEFDQGLTYLGPDGPGKFGIIISRKSIDQRVKVLQTFSWLKEHKMLITLADADVRRMISLYSEGKDPAQVIKEAIDRVRTAVL